MNYGLKLYTIGNLLQFHCSQHLIKAHVHALGTIRTVVQCCLQWVCDCSVCGCKSLDAQSFWEAEDGGLPGGHSATACTVYTLPNAQQ